MKKTSLSAQVSWGGNLVGSSRKLGLVLSLVGSAPVLSLHLRVIRPSWGGSYTNHNANIFILTEIFDCQMGLLLSASLYLSLGNLIKVKNFLTENKGRAKVHNKKVPPQCFLRPYLETLENQRFLCFSHTHCLSFSFPLKQRPAFCALDLGSGRRINPREYPRWGDIAESQLPDIWCSFLN